MPDEETTNESSATELQRVAEALIFAGDEPVPAETVAEVYASVRGEEVAGADVEEAVEALNRAYRQAGRAFRIRTWAGGYRMATVREVAPYVRALVEAEEERRLSRSLLETLAVIAYKQPVTKPEIDFVRGVDADYALKKLLAKNFVAVVGRSEAVGRPLLYGTTDRFLEQFGLAAIDELPRPREIEQLLNDPAFTHERTELLIDLDHELGDSSPASHGEPATEQK
jgi:segregation and condensation protein B